MLAFVGCRKDLATTEDTAVYIRRLRKGNRLRRLSHRSLG
jgi:hypothetical protein